MRKVMEKIFVGTWKMIMKVFLRKKILGDMLVEYLGNIFWKEIEGDYSGNIWAVFLETIWGGLLGKYL
jgi:hypothetical protein